MESFPLNLSAVYVTTRTRPRSSQPFSTPGREIDGAVAFFVLAITAGIFLVVSILLVHVLIRYRARPGESSEPPAGIRELAD